ncbi:alpha/beta fold hydrolase [Paraburkholderia kirstenboschensis]|jgi:pimeloyl-ACP methyl ester carboxylesterase|uniref:Alpha/beta hydrolase n=1 Tax=Paraburkholderia kirstenboschensis TaxID=1245436 RepID=A0ABZ0EF77_9BURK|nr:hypothetical protein [Paraburkholderia kirstenboschensis]WOD15889.1 hypothetical protein RW095_21915 [Paraburkholderia kirstenboschensis]
MEVGKVRFGSKLRQPACRLHRPKGANGMPLHENRQSSVRAPTLSGLPARRGINGSSQSAVDVHRAMFADGSSAVANVQLSSPVGSFKALSCRSHIDCRELQVSMSERVPPSDDKVIDPQANAVRLHREIAHSTLVIARGAGHMVHYAVPAEIVEAIDLMSAGQSVGTGDSNAAIDETSAAERLPVAPAEA